MWMDFMNIQSRTMTENPQMTNRFQHHRQLNTGAEGSVGTKC
jgi:hypothetical protein